jgi:hypothetical protein
MLHLVRRSTAVRAALSAFALASTLTLPGCSDPQAGTIRLGKNESEIVQDVARIGRTNKSVPIDSNPETFVPPSRAKR